MPAVGAAIVAIGGSIGLTAAASMTVAIQLGVSAAMSVASNIMRRRAMADSAQSAGIRTERKGTGGVNSRTLMLGRYATAGTDVCPPMSHGRTSKTPNIYLTQVIALADLPVGGLNRVIINGEYVQLEAFTGPFGPEYRVLGKYQSPDEDDRDDPDRAWVRFYDGTQTAACPYLVANYSDYPDRPWSPAMVGRGMAYAVMAYRFDPSVWTGEPVAKFEIDGCRLYDPRRDSTVGGSGSHRWADQSTWGGPGDNNPIVMVYNILRGIRMRDGSIYGGRAEAADLPLDNWVAAMNRCDETVGGQPRFRAGFEVKVAEDQPADIIDELLLTCLGEIVEVGGYFKVRVGGPGLPVGFFVDSDFLNSQPKEFDPFPPLTSTHNLVNYVFPHPAEMYASHDGPVWMPEPVTTERPLSLAFKALPYPAQAQRVARAMLADDQRHRVHTASLGPYASHLEPLDVIEWTSSRNGYIDKRFDIRQTTENIRNLCLGLGMRETDPNDYDYRPGEDLPDPVSPGGWVVTPTQAVPGWDIQPYVIVDNLSQARAPALQASWDREAADDVVALLIKYRVAGTTAEMTKTVARPSLVSFDIISEGIASNVDYEACAKHIVPGRRTAFTSWLPVRSPDVRLGRGDVDYDAIVGEVLESFGEFYEFMDESGDVLRELQEYIGEVVDRAVEGDFGELLAREQLRAELAVDNAQSRALFRDDINVILTEQNALAVRQTTLRAEYLTSAAQVRQDVLAMAEEGGAFAALVDEVRAEIPGAVATATSGLVSRVEDTEEGLSAQSDRIDVVQARTNRGTASGTFRVTAESTPAGVSSRIGLQAEATSGSTSSLAALYLQARTDGVNEAMIVADRFAIVAGTGPNANRGVPFLVAGGQVYMDTAFIQDLTVGTIKIQDEAITTYPYAYSAGIQSITEDQYGSWVTLQVLTLNRGRNSPMPINMRYDYVSGSTIGSATVRLIRDGLSEPIWQRSGLGEGGNFAAHMTCVDVSPGTGPTTYRLQVNLSVQGGDVNINRRFIGCLNALK